MLGRSPEAAILEAFQKVNIGKEGVGVVVTQKMPKKVQGYVAPFATWQFEAGKVGKLVNKKTRQTRHILSLALV